MRREVGLWIDHRQAVVVIVTDEREETRRVTSNMERHTRFAGRSSQDRAREDTRDRQFAAHLRRYYDDVIAHRGDAEAIQILGPGQAKTELEQRIESGALKGRIVAVETVDKMTDRQIAERVRQRFRA
jgi:stalled ribosome rescue protein Dom34